MSFQVAVALFAALATLCSAASYGGVKDLAGNYYDFSTGQYSSALTGKVYNTAPVAAAPVAYVPGLSPVAAAAPYYYAPYYYPYAGAAAYVAPAWK